MILLFHELGNQKNKYCISVENFKKIVEKYPEAEIHFDDGRRGILALEDSYLKNLAQRTTIFMVPNFCLGLAPIHECYSDFLSVIETKKLIKMGFKIGSHSCSHQDLTRLSMSELDFQLNYSKYWLEREFNVKVNKFSFPYGLTNNIIALKAAKYYNKLYTIELPLGIQRTMIVSNR